MIATGVCARRDFLGELPGKAAGGSGSSGGGGRRGAHFVEPPGSAIRIDQAFHMHRSSAIYFDSRAERFGAPTCPGGSPPASTPPGRRCTRHAL